MGHDSSMTLGRCCGVAVHLICVGRTGELAALATWMMGVDDARTRASNVDDETACNVFMGQRSHKTSSADTEDISFLIRPSGQQLMKLCEHHNGAGELIVQRLIALVKEWP